MSYAQFRSRRSFPSHARTSRPFAALAALGVLVCATACSDATTAPDATREAAGPSASLGLANNATADTLAVGKTVQLTATLRTGFRSTTPVWRSSNAAVATVSSSGLVTAVAAGTATVSVSNGTSSNSVTILVAAPVPAPVGGGDTGMPARVLAFLAASNVPTVAALQAKGGAYAQYEADFARFADYHWTNVYQDVDSTSFASNFYDRAMIYYVWWARTGNPTYLYRANKLALGARAYLASVNYYPMTYNMMIDGVALHALVTGDPASRDAVARVADAMANPNGYMSYVAGDPNDPENDSRHQARVLSAVLDAYLLKVPSPAGYDYAARLADLVTRVMGTQAPDGAYRWRNQCGYNKPFMTGMVDEALIRTYYSFQADSRIVASVKRAADYMWASDWFPASSAFTYLDGTCTAESGGPPGAPDLNNLIATSYAFVARQTGDASYFAKGDAVFAGGVTGTWLYGPKQFNQEYTASYRFLSLRF